MNDTTLDLISRKEAARLLGVHQATLWKWTKQEKMDLPYIKIGERLKYRKRDIEEFIKRHTMKESEI